MAAVQVPLVLLVAGVSIICDGLLVPTLNMRYRIPFVTPLFKQKHIFLQRKQYYTRVLQCKRNF